MELDQIPFISSCDTVAKKNYVSHRVRDRKTYFKNSETCLGHPKIYKSNKTGKSKMFTILMIHTRLFFLGSYVYRRKKTNNHNKCLLKICDSALNKASYYAFVQ